MLFGFVIVLGCSAQDNPYAVFGYNPKVTYKSNPEDKYRVKNLDRNSIIKYVEFDFEDHQITLLGKKDSVIKKFKFDNDALLRWLSPDAKASKYPGLSPYNFVENSPIVSIDPDGDEKIVLTGGKDLHNTNRMNFVMASKIELKNYVKAVKSKGSHEKVSWLIFDLDYTTKEKREFSAWAKAHGVGTPIFVKSSDDVVNYINSANVSAQNLTAARKEDQITDLSAFSHGTPSFLRFGYENTGVNKNKYSPSDFGMQQAVNILRGSFAQTSDIDLFSCNAATPLSYEKYNFASRQQMIQSSLPGWTLVSALSHATGATVNGLIGRTDYSVVGNGTLPIPGLTGGDYSPTVQNQAIPAIKVTSTTDPKTNTTTSTVH